MKKFLAILAALFCFSSFSFADEVSDLLKEPEDTKTRTIFPEDQHTTNKTAKVQIEYTPSVDEVRIYYTVFATSYDQNEAADSIRECLKDFQDANQYFSYKYMRKDSVRYIKDEKGLKWAVYQSYVKFTR